jgi:hypothetical protein
MLRGLTRPIRTGHSVGGGQAAQCCHDDAQCQEIGVLE